MELAAAGPGQSVILCAAIIFRLAPGRDEPAFLLHAMESGEEGAGLDVKSAFCELFDAAGDAEAVHLVQGQGFQNHHVESALEELGLICCHDPPIDDL